MSNDKVNRLAVENFLGSLDMEMTEQQHVLNARMDAISYGWNSATLYHILDGISKAYCEFEDKGA